MISPVVPPPSLMEPAPLDKNSKEAAEQFEAFLYTFMAKNLRGSTPGGMFSSGPMQTFASLFDEEIGKGSEKAIHWGLQTSWKTALRGWPCARPPLYRWRFPTITVIQTWE